MAVKQNKYRDISGEDGCPAEFSSCNKPCQSLMNSDPFAKLGKLKRKSQYGVFRTKTLDVSYTITK